MAFIKFLSTLTFNKFFSMENNGRAIKLDSISFKTYNLKNKNKIFKKYLNITH